MNPDRYPYQFVRITNSGRPPTGPCPVCSIFASETGRIWRMSDIPMPPYHINCRCIVTNYYPESPDDIVTELPALDEKQLAGLLYLVVEMLLNGHPIPELLKFLIPQAEEKIKKMTAEPLNTKIEFTSDGELRAVLVEPGRTRTITNQPGRHTFTAAAITDAYHRGLFRGLSCFIDHTQGHPSVRNLLGIWTDISADNGRITASLTPFITDETRPILELLEQLRATPREERPDIGLSLVLYPSRVSSSGEIEAIQTIESADLVLFPAVPSARFLFHSHGETTMTPQTPGTADTNWPNQPDPQWDAEYRRTAAAAVIDLTDLPALVKTRLKTGTYQTPAEMHAAIDSARQELASLHDANIINLPGRPRIQMRDPLEEAQEVANYLFGAASATPPANMRRVDEWYVALTGDVHFRGTFDPDRVQFAGATTTTLANVAVNAMNKVIIEQMSNLDAWRWYERITSVEPNDGSLHAMQWITIGGISNLPTVAEGASYTELVVDDAKESSSFTKLGGYVGITRELLKNSDIARLQAIPRALATAAIRSRSAAVSAIFTANSGTGPTLAQDATVLFHSNHANVNTTALGTDATAWRAARTEAFKHTDVNSGKRLAIYPRFLLVPADLYDIALSILGYGEGMPTTYTPEAQARGFADPRPIPLVVPDWTDATDWAYIVDPAVFPVIQMSYSQNPGGRSHPAPELFAVVSETNGLLFTNDTMPIKVRDEFAVGVNGPRGIGKRNVA